MRIRIKRLHADAVLPALDERPERDGMRLCAVETLTLNTGVPCLVPTGLVIELPPGYQAQIRPCNSLALEHGVIIANAPGTVDPGYRGEIGVVLLNLAPNPHVVQKGDFIAKLVVTRYEPIEWVESSLAASDDIQVDLE